MNEIKNVNADDNILKAIVNKILRFYNRSSR